MRRGDVVTVAAPGHYGKPRRHLPNAVRPQSKMGDLTFFEYPEFLLSNMNEP